MHVHYIPTDEARDWWPTLGGYVNKAAKRYHKDYDLDDMQRAIFEGKAALFGVFEGLKPIAAIVASEVAYPKRKVLLIELVGGDNMADWFDKALLLLTEHAKGAGYGAITAQGRMGWRDWAKRANFKQVFVGYEIDLETGGQE